MSTPGPVLLTTNVIGNAVMSPRVEPQVTSHASGATVSLSGARAIPPKTAHNTSEHDISMSTTSGAAVSTIQSTPSCLHTSGAFSNVLISTPPSHCMQVDDVGQFPVNDATSSSGSVQGPPKDGFALANSHRMVRKISSNDVFAKKFHINTTEEELSDYLIANNII